MKDKLLRPIPAPTGDFILKSGVPYVQTDNGAYYHYIHVCSLLDRMKKVEQLLAYRVVYWRNVFEVSSFFTSEMQQRALIKCNAFIITRIRELQNQLYPPQTPTNAETK